jgi:peptidyl-prolyl cis-trans isomerase C
MKRKQQLWGFIAAVVLAAACLFPFCADAEQPKAKPAAKPAPAQNDPVIAVVNGSKLHQSDLKWQMDNIKRGNPGADQSSEADQKMRKMALQELIGFELLYQDSLSLGIKDVDKQVDDMIASGVKQFGSQEKLNEQLAKDGLTLDHVRKILRKNILIQAEVDKRIAPQVTVTEADIEAYYEANKDRLKHDGLVGARHILVKFPPNATEEQKKAALDKIQALRAEIAGGKDFAEVAQANSDCPSKAKGGDLGYFPKGAMVPEFEKAAFSLNEGELSQVVETSYGYHLILVYGKKPAGTVPLADVRGQLEKDVQQRKLYEAMKAQIEKLQKTAKVQILDKTLADKDK